jgi:hypothetical protein
MIIATIAIALAYYYRRHTVETAGIPRASVAFHSSASWPEVMPRMVAAVLFFNLVKLLHEDREASAPYFQKKPSPVMYMANTTCAAY